MPLLAEEWVSQVRLAVQQYFPTAELQIEIVRETRVKARLTISEDHFVDLFFREETERVDYALIANDRRIFGIDNLGGWHEHPLDDPESHKPCSELTPTEAIRRLREAYDAVKAEAS